MTLLTVRGLTKSFRSSGGGLKAERLVAVRDVSFDIEAGETFAVVGESGAGKSTVARLVIRLIEPDEGSVHMDGTDLRALSRSELRRFRRWVQMVFQDPHSALDPRFEIGRAIAQPLRVHFGMSRSDRERETVRLLDSVGLDQGYAHRFPHQLSGGQLQRVCIARALAVKPKLIVCDEAVSALDVSIRAQILNLLTEIQEREHVAYLFITHDLAVVEALADRVAVMPRRGDRRVRDDHRGDVPPA